MSYLPDDYRFRVQMDDDDALASQPQQQDTHSFIPLPHAPWIPMEALRETWATFAIEASTAPLLHSTSEAFAALGYEQSALVDYQQHVRERKAHHATHLPVPFTTQTHTLMGAIDDLEYARVHWQRVLMLLDEAREQQTDDEERHALTHLILSVLQQLTRLAVLVACLASEQEEQAHRLLSSPQQGARER